MDFSGLPEGMPHILDAKAKWAKNSAEYKGTKSVLADVPDELRARLQKVALDAYRALRVRDYGRVDLRLTETGEIYVIEVNANCYLEQYERVRRRGRRPRASTSPSWSTGSSSWPWSGTAYSTGLEPRLICQSASTTTASEERASR